MASAKCAGECKKEGKAHSLSGLLSKHCGLLSNHCGFHRLVFQPPVHVIFVAIYVDERTALNQFTNLSQISDKPNLLVASTQLFATAYVIVCVWSYGK